MRELRYPVKERLLYCDARSVSVLNPDYNVFIAALGVGTVEPSRTSETKRSESAGVAVLA